MPSQLGSLGSILALLVIVVGVVALVLLAAGQGVAFAPWVILVLVVVLGVARLT